MTELNPGFLETYQWYRTQHEMPARDAATYADSDLRLKKLLGSGEYRIRWEHDPDLDLSWEEDATERARLNKQINDGELEHVGVVLERRHVCDRCNHETWEHVDSLWGIIIAPGDTATQRYFEAGLDF